MQFLNDDFIYYKVIKPFLRLWDSSEPWSEPLSTNVETVVNLPRNGRPTKITPRAQWRLIQEVIKEPRTTSKELQASLASVKVSVHDSTIRKRLGKKTAKAIADQKEHKGSSHICQKNILIKYSNIYLGKYSVDWWDKSWTFWKVCVLLDLA